MSDVLLISDHIRRTMKLALDLDISEPSLVHDIYDDKKIAIIPEFIIVDVDSLDSKALVRLLAVLKEKRRDKTPLLFLAHGNAGRVQAQAEVIGATITMPADTAIRTLRATAVRMRQSSEALGSLAAKLADEARQFLVKIFFSGATPTPELVANGSDLIADAVAESGVRNWVSAVQQFDNATHQHCLLVAGLAAAFASSLGLGRMEGFRLTKAALLHDVGKTQIPTAILNKPGPLTTDEMAVMRTHAVKGYEMLKDGDFASETLGVVRSHHELLNGSGYPDGLKENQISDLVRLTTICDIFGALVERRSYKPPLPASQAYSIIAGMTGRLDMNLVAAFRPVTEAMA